MLWRQTFRGTLSFAAGLTSQLWSAMVLIHGMCGLPQFLLDVLGFCVCERCSEGAVIGSRGCSFAFSTIGEDISCICVFFLLCRACFMWARVRPEARVVSAASVQEKADMSRAQKVKSAAFHCLQLPSFMKGSKPRLTASSCCFGSSARPRAPAEARPGNPNSVISVKQRARSKEAPTA